MTTFNSSGEVSVIISLVPGQTRGEEFEFSSKWRHAFAWWVILSSLKDKNETIQKYTCYCNYIVV